MTTQTKRVALPADFINVGAKNANHTAPAKAAGIPVPVQLVGIIIGVFGVMSILNAVYKVATGH